MSADEKTQVRDAKRRDAEYYVTAICGRNDLGDAYVTDLRQLLNLGGTGTKPCPRSMYKAILARDKDQLVQEMRAYIRSKTQ